MMFFDPLAAERNAGGEPPALLSRATTRPASSEKPARGDQPLGGHLVVSVGEPTSSRAHPGSG
jgi:hypothetical protein